MADLYPRVSSKTRLPNNINRALPRSVLALVAGMAMEAQTPEDRR